MNLDGTQADKNFLFHKFDKKNVSTEIKENYVYVSGTSPVFRNHFEEYAIDIIKEFNPSYEELIIEILSGG